ncbi:MAG: ParB/RepB/Spo0J family partition protein [Candidatus Coatesbacteria bacterium]|nr:ParB/RepB/Spo0J family partition protein [Candidatus Coatesbacteria bacterium]
MEHIKLDDIIPNASQPRKTFYEESLKELSQSIKERGVLEPIVVRPKGSQYEIVMGERRYRASKLAGLTEIPAVVREMSDEDMACDSLLENFQREDLNPVDRAKAIEGLLEFMTWDQCAKALGVSESTLRRYLELLELPAQVQKALVESWDKNGSATFTEAHARVLKSLNGDLATQLRMIEKIGTDSLSVAETKKLVDAITQVPAKKEAFLRIPLRATEEILQSMGRAQNKMKPFKPQTADIHLAALEKAANQLSNLIDERLVDYLKETQMNQLLSTCQGLLHEVEKLSNKIRYSLQKGDDGWKEVYIHCPMCGRIELIGSMRCVVCGTVLRRCLDCGNYDKMYQKCGISESYVYMSEADAPDEHSKSYKCEDYKPRFELSKAA